MHPFRKRALALAAAAIGGPIAGNVAAQSQSQSQPQSQSQAAAPAQTIDVVGTRQRLDAARNGLSPDTGSTLYRLDRQDIKNLPQGDGTPLNQVILQTPGVAQDSYGQLHVRGDHANIQYRINGVLVPEAISGFGQALETRFIDRLSIITGALPAQYGYRNAAVIDIQTRNGELANAGSVGLTVGNRRHGELVADIGGSADRFSWFVSHSSVTNRLGIENPTASRNALHDTTWQSKDFGMLSYLLGDSSRISLMVGNTDNRFQIPNVPGETPQFTLANSPPADSATLDARQRERNRFGVLAWQGSWGTSVDWQVSLIDRTTDVRYQPDVPGELQFNGLAADILRRNRAAGLQADASWRLNDSHTLRSGLFAQRERFTTNNRSQVFPADDDGEPTSTVPISIADDTRIRGRLFGAYVQDEWKPLSALTVNYGVRWDQIRTVTDESAFSPRLGVVFEPTKTLRLHAGYARYVTPPPTEKIDTTSIQKFLNTTNALPSDANTAVRSEQSDYYDAGVAWQATRELTLSADAYWRKVKHLQDEGQFGNALIFSAFNFEQGRIGGIDLSATYKERAFSGYVNLSFSRARGKGIETGQFNFEQDELDYIAQNWVHLDHEQRINASAGASYRFDGDLTLSASALFGSGLRRGFANTEHLPGYATVDLAAAKTFDLGSAFGKLETRLALVNAFDRVYQLRDGSGIGVGAPQFGQRRTVYLTVTKPFTF